MWKTITICILLITTIYCEDPPADNSTDTTPPPDPCQVAIEEKKEFCELCCIKTDDSKDVTCVGDILKCPLKPNSDFGVLVTIVIIIGAFAVGIPIILLIIDKVMCGRLFGCKMSLCECIANYICCCFCLSKVKTLGDDEKGYAKVNHIDK